MKKTLSIIMALCMVLSVCFFSVAAAPEGTAITDAAGFAAMDPAGTYYLANDITLSEPYAASFTGTLDGNGKTVTISQPMFVDFGGTIKNLTVEGSVTSLAADAEIAALAADGARGAVAAKVASGTEVVFENIVNNASISATGSLDSDDCAGGIVGKIGCEGVSVKFTNCVNNAAITGLNQIGGIVGYAKTVASITFTGCANNGEIMKAASSAYCGGIVCRIDSAVASFENCLNTGAVTSGKDQAGGILTYASKCSSVVINNCENTGAIHAIDGKAAGIAGNINADDTKNTNGRTITVTNCVNSGTITNTDPNTEDDKYAGGIVAQAQKTQNFTISNCVNTGSVTGVHDTGGIVGHTTNAIMYISFCENTGKIESTTNYAGGITGYGQGLKVADNASANGGISNIIEFCINSGEIVGSTRTGGIAASIGASGVYGISEVRYCVNTGNVTSNGNGTSAAANSAGGIVGYGYGQEGEQTVYVLNNITTGNVESKGAEKGVAAYFMAYINSTEAKVMNNQAIGTLTSPVATYAISWNNASEFAAENVTGNALPEGNTYPLTYENTIVDKTYTVGTTNEAALKSGETIYALNQAYKAATGTTEDVVYMTIDGTFAPTLIAAENGSNSVIKNADGSYSNPAPAAEDTTPEDTTPDTTEPGESTPTGDSALLFAIIAVISVLGVAVVSKKREN